MEKNRDTREIDLTLRPKTWEEYVGQEKVKRHLQLIIQAARERNESCDHLLFHGQAGLGKTTLAYLIAHEMNVPMKCTSGPALEKTGDIAALLTNLNPYEIIFIDEVHRMNKLIEEVLYPAMESRKLHLMVGKGPSAKTLTIDLPPFTLIAATTKAHLLSNPLRSRFGGSFHLDYYSPSDIGKIINRSSKILEITVTQGAIEKIARASRFTPRIANRLLKRVRDYAQVHRESSVNEEIVSKTLEMLEIDELGLEPIDRKILEVVIQKFNGGPVGIKAIAAALNEDPFIIEDVYEPYLMSIGFLQRTSLGRIAAKDASAHLKIATPRKLL